MAEFSEKVKKRYLNGHSAECPFCGSTQIEGETVEINGGGAYQDVRCLKCDNRWRDVYQLVDVVPTCPE